MSQVSASDAGAYLRDLLTLLREFEKTSPDLDLRARVKALIPAYETLKNLGKSLIPHGLAMAARDRILHYFLAYPCTVIPREELEIVAGITEWARRVRELRVEHGWHIVSGKAAQQMQSEGEFTLEDVDVGAMRPDDYILTSTVQDKKAAYRWNVANDIRRSDLSVRDRLLEYLRRNVGEPVSGEELRYVARQATEWARRVRELRTEHGWPIATRFSGRPDLSVGEYVLEEDRQSPEHDRRISDDTRGQVLRRDQYTCRRCGWDHSQWNRSDPRHLELHHIIHHEAGGSNEADNLITLCTVCHDTWHGHDADNPPPDFYVWLDTA